MQPFPLCILLVSLLLAPLAHAGTEQWAEVRSPHFVVMTDSNAKQAVHLADQFERMRAVFHSLFPKARVDEPSPIVVIAVKDRKGFEALEPAAYLAKGQLTLAGLFLRGNDKNYILLRLDAQPEHALETVYHEYTHFMLREDAAWLPLWLNEGLASFFQNTDIHDKEVNLGRPNADDILYLREKQMVPLPVIFQVDHASPYYHDEQKGSIFYAESWALVHYLETSDNKNHTHRVSDYTELLSHHEDPVTAATEAFGDLKRLQSDLSGYVERSSFSYFRISAPAVVDPSQFQVRPVTPLEADARRADFLAYNGRSADAEALLNSVLREEPNNAAACETMGYMALLRNDQATAKQWLTKAVARSDSYLTHYYYAVMSMNDIKEESAAQVESSLKKAIELNPAFAPSYDALAGFYGRRNEHLAEAHLLNAQAIERDPANLQFRIHSARVLLASNRVEDASRALKAAAEVAQTPEQKSSLQSEQALVDDLMARLHAPGQPLSGSRGSML